jgi:WD40 repeat protein
VKVWEGNVVTGDNLSVKASFVPEELQGSSCNVAWNHTNQVLAVTSKAPTISLIHAHNGHLLSTVPFTNAEIDRTMNFNKCVFSLNSRYVASSIGEKGIVLWDLKRRNMRMKLDQHDSPVVDMCYISDSILLAGESAGTVKIWNVKMGAPAGEVYNTTSESSRTLNCIQPSRSGQYKLAGGCADGVMCVWDMNTAVLLREQRVHREALTAISFSPKNTRLVATTGLDGRMALVDTASRTSADPSASIDLGEPLSSVSFHEDSIHCAVGTVSGSILLYDWRSIRRPLCRIDAHGPEPVQQLAFQNPTSASGAAATSSSAAPLHNTEPVKHAQSAPAASDDRNNVQSSHSGKVSSPSGHTSRLGSVQSRAVEVGATERGSKVSDVGQAGISGDTRGEGASGRAMPRHALTMGTSLRPEETEGERLGGESEAAQERLRERYLQKAAAEEKSSAETPGRVAVRTGKTGDSEATSAQEHGPNRTADVLGTGDTDSGSDVYIAPSMRSETRHKGEGAFMGDNSGRDPAAGADAKPSGADAAGGAPFDALRGAMKAVSSQELQDSLMQLRYDIHKEVREVIREQSRQFELSRDDTAELIAGMSAMLQEVLSANKALREENERLRRIY